MEKELLLNSVVESQAQVILLKNQEIEGLKAQLLDSKKIAEELKRKLDSHSFQAVIDELHFQICGAVQQSLEDGAIEYRRDPTFVSADDTINLPGAAVLRLQAKVKIAEIRQVLDYTLMPFMTPELRTTALEMTSQMISQLLATCIKSFIFYQLPLPITGLGVLTATRHDLGGRFLITYNPNVLRQEIVFQLAYVDAEVKEAS